MVDESLDLELAALLRSPERAPDEAFARRLERLVVAEARLRAARRAAWHRFTMEMVAAAALLLAFALLTRSAPPPDSAGTIPLFGPAAAGLLLLALWIAVSLRPGESAATH
ncbi:MAG: hypothetical protein JOZ90_13060 [Alphaproteobacteria bacterium]|nr:hypothetical protein [Alphaproteobacteria bacterium]MBV9370340.1 hypothetical protein [Alphaproteobacteria bacterium]MBV9902003.1 hypothetical protein [Alphaproteobacteria bacterium]